MKKILFSLSAFLMISCGSVKNTPQEMTYAAHMVNVYEKNYTQEQFDSICGADKLPLDLAKWHANSLRDFETMQQFTEYVFIKKLGDEQIIYRLEKNENGYRITKRITK